MHLLKRNSALRGRNRAEISRSTENGKGVYTSFLFFKYIIMRKYERSVWLETVSCGFCDTAYVPKRRFVQKYCSESCRVMACRERKNGYLDDLSGVGKRNNTKDMVTNAHLSLQLNSLQSDLKADLSTLNSKANWMLIIEVVSMIKSFFDTWSLKKANERDEKQFEVLKLILAKHTKNNQSDLAIIKEFVKHLNPKHSRDIEKLF